MTHNAVVIVHGSVKRMPTFLGIALKKRLAFRGLNNIVSFSSTLHKKVGGKLNAYDGVGCVMKLSLQHHENFIANKLAWGMRNLLHTSIRPKYPTHIGMAFHFRNPWFVDTKERFARIAPDSC